MASPNTKKLRLGIFGGSFDPIHVGHLLVATAAREELRLDRLIFVLAAHSPFKPDQKPSPATERLKLLRLALAGKEWCQLDTQEVQRGGISYTIDTIRDISGRHRDAELFYLIGADHVAQLPKWREASELARLVTFVVVPRPGQRETAFPEPFKGQWLTGFPLGISSSQIRARVKSGLTIDGLVPATVAEAICNNRLYL